MTRTGAFILAAVVVAAFFVGSMASSDQAAAARGVTGTFQLEAYGNNLGGGAYILNTETGEVFLAQSGGKPQFIGTATR